MIPRPLGPLGTGHPWPDPQQAIIDAVCDGEFGDLLGPSWAGMTPDQRRRYPDRWTPADWAAVDGSSDAAA